MVPGLLPAYLTRVQRSRMRLKQNGRQPGNEANKLPRPAFEEKLFVIVVIPGNLGIKLPYHVLHFEHL